MAFSKGVLNPELTCPPPAILKLQDYSMTITLIGADFKGRKEESMEYIPELVDTSAAYEIPNKLILSRNSVGRNYSVLVKARDVDGVEAKCRFSIAVKGRNGERGSGCLVSYVFYISTFKNKTFKFYFH